MTAPTAQTSNHRPTAGQALAIFAIFLVVLMGASALAVDYANWLLVDRQLQNISDHAALAGAVQFSSDFTASSCSGGGGPAQCTNGRTQAWASLNQELVLGLTDATIATLASRNSPAAGDGSVAQGGGTVAFNHTIWVSTPPPLQTGGHTEYSQVGGLYAGSFGIVFVRVDQPTRSFFGGIFGIHVRDRIGWATAGILPTDFALSVYCRNNIAPESGVCADGGTSLGIDGGGGITLARGDVGSSNSLQVTAQTGQGVIVEAGNVFVENGTCGSSTWKCPPSTVGGISDGAGNAKNAFFVPPLPVPQYALPTGAGTLPWNDGPTTTCSSIAGCIPGTGTAPNYPTPIDWSCVIGSGTGACGTPAVTTTAGVSTVTCTSNGVATQHMRPNADVTISPSSPAAWNGTAGGGNIYPNINESSVDPAGSLATPPTLPTTLAGSPTSFAYSKDGVTNAQYRVSLTSPNGTLQSPGSIYLRWVLFKVKKSGGSEVIDNAGGAVSVTAQLQENVSGTWINRGTPDTETATSTITAYQGKNAGGTAVGYADVTSIGNPNALSILFTVTNASSDHGAGISWAEAYIDQPPVPPPPPTIPPGLYRSIVIPDGGCAVLDPTGYYQGGLKQYQMPGVYYFKDASGGQNATISLGTGSELIGDGVTLVFDSNWPGPSGSGGQASAHGIEMAANAALVLNTAVSGYNPSTPLSALPSDALAAAWQVNPASTTSGVSTWGGPCASVSPCQVSRSSYSPTANWRGVTFYFKPKTNGSTNSASYSVLGRFAMSGGVAGLAFRGILYAPYDDVQISGANGFDTVGMVLAWTAKFNGGSASINLDFPFARLAAAPYLLEPSIRQ